VSKKVKAKYLLLILLPYLIFYFFIQSAITSGYNFLTEFDELIPFVPEFIWIYHTILPIIVLTVVSLIEKKEVFFTAIAGFLFAALITSAFYVFLPASYPRDAYIDSSTSGYLVELTRIIDGPSNTFPSSHVTFAWLTVLFVGLSKYANTCKWVRPAYFFWALLISVSTLVLKQHFIIDVFSGIALALICYYLGKRLIFERMLTTN